MIKTSKQQTIDTYNKSAKELAEYFSGISGQRKKFIDKIFGLVHKDNPTVLEVGCGDGREAEYIIKKTKYYKGFDISSEMIRLAKERNLPGEFFVDDLESYKTSEKFDLVLALSSLLHSDANTVQEFIYKIGDVLNDEGVFAFDLKMASQYEVDTKEDRFGVRTFYYYPQELTKKMLQKKYKILFIEKDKIGETNWLMVVVKKK